MFSDVIFVPAFQLMHFFDLFFPQVILSPPFSNFTSFFLFLFTTENNNMRSNFALSAMHYLIFFSPEDVIIDGKPILHWKNVLTWNIMVTVMGKQNCNLILNTMPISSVAQGAECVLDNGSKTNITCCMLIFIDDGQVEFQKD